MTSNKNFGARSLMVATVRFPRYGIDDAGALRRGVACPGREWPGESRRAMAVTGNDWRGGPRRGKVQ